jgi:hypothetical protein
MQVGERHCLACGARIGLQDALCPSCGALNTRGLGDEESEVIAAPRKRFKFLWWTYTVRGTEMDYLRVDSAFGMRTSVTWGRWVLSNVLFIGLVAVMCIVFLSVWASTGETPALAGALLFALLGILELAFFAWSMTPPRTPHR